MTKAETAVSSKASKLLIVDILKLQKQVLDGFEKLTEVEKQQFKTSVLSFQQSTDDISRNKAMSEVATLLNVDFNAVIASFAKHGPKAGKAFKGISEREIIVTATRFLGSPVKFRSSSLVKSDEEMSLDELESLIDSATPTSCESSKASKEECICIYACAGISLVAIAGCTATGPLAPACYAGVAIAFTACIAACS